MKEANAESKDIVAKEMAEWQEEKAQIQQRQAKVKEEVADKLATGQKFAESMMNEATEQVAEHKAKVVKLSDKKKDSSKAQKEAQKSVEAIEKAAAEKAEKIAKE